MLTDLPAWKALANHRQNITLTDKPDFKSRHITLPSLTLDYSRHLLGNDTFPLLLALAKARQIETVRDDMFAGKIVNRSEKRPALHTALRRPAGDKVMVDGVDIIPGIHETLSRMEKLSESVRNGSWKGHTGKKIEHIVNIGIGGSDLGPRMVVEALRDRQNLSVHFVANIDGHDLSRTLSNCNPETTLFLIASKSFTTEETMVNARTARQWLLASLKDEKAIPRHFVALASNLKETSAFGIPAENVFPFGDWVGGRYSLWSSIGLSIALSAGFPAFRALLDGAVAMDQHFRSAPLDKNMPVIMALLGIWYRNLWNADGLAILPYDQRLERFPSFLQQLDMESNGKGVDQDGNTLSYDTAGIVFGTPGTNFQHSFGQLLHQGTSLIPCDLIGVINPDHELPGHHERLLSHMVAQAEALWHGRTLEESGANPHRLFKGRRPSSLLLMDQLNPFNLGQLITLYEHKVFVQGVLWNIDSFDQWGVELGKLIAPEMQKGLQGGAPAPCGVIDFLREKRSRP